MRVVLISLAPLGELGDFSERGVGNLDREQPEKRLAGSAVVLRLGADEV